MSLGREGPQKHWSHQPPLYVRTALEAWQGSPVCQLLSPVLVCAFTCDVLLTPAPYHPCMNDSDFPLQPPLSVNPGVVLGDPVLLWLWLPLPFAYFPNTFLKSFPLSSVRCPFVRLEDCPREWGFKFCSLHRHWLVFTLRAVFSRRTSYKLSV